MQTETRPLIDPTSNVQQITADLLSTRREPSPLEIDAHEYETACAAVPGGAENVQDVYALSPLQEGMLFHHLLHEQNDTYVLSTLFELEGRERVDALIDALQSVLTRHDVLRTAILWERLSRPLQVVYRRAVLPVETLQLDPSCGVIQQLRERMRPGRQRLDLRQAPLLRLQIAADPHGVRWYALLQLHHVVSDYRSWNIVLAETVACLAGRARELPVALSYRDHVAWALTHARPREAREFFGNKLGDVIQPTAPFGLLDTRGDGSQIEEVREHVPPDLARKVRSEARRATVSAARLFHAAWGLVVARTSGMDDVVYATVILASQLRGERSDRMVGLSVNTLPLRLRMQDLTARGLVEHTHRELGELLQHEHAPLTLAQSCSGLDAATPLFSALLNYRHNSADGDHVGAAGVRVIARADAWTNYPLAITVDDLGEEFAVTAQVDCRVGAQRVISMLNAAMHSLVDALETSPDVPVLSLQIVPRSELQRAAIFNATEVSYPKDALIHRMFERQAALTPNEVAVLHGGRSLTYAELNEKAIDVASLLLQLDVVPDEVVGVCMERSPEMVVGLIGILKAGAAYLPLDPNYPRERLQYMLEDAAPRVVLTHEAIRSALPATQAQVVMLGRELAGVPRRQADGPALPDAAVTPRNLVYVIYTSGSTGLPKGTAMTHGAMANLLHWHRDQLPLQPGQRVLQFAALSFDVAFQEIFSTLCGGGTLVLIDEWMRKDARALLERLGSQRVARLFVPPMMLQALAECAATTSVVPADLRDVIAAGEQLRISPEIARFASRIPGCCLHNHYGPTETHVVTALTLKGDARHWPPLPSIGRPIANTQIHILDARRLPVPVGVVGEIYIGGANVARGYLHKPNMTAARFVADPFRTGADPRMYKTGDLGRWRPDGTIDYLGRNDDQVKIRGFRVELAEIEAQLANLSQVREAAVIAREEVVGEKRLIAYVVPRDGADADVDALSAQLRARIPEHMVPAAFVILEKLPLTPSGKLNRRALPAPRPGARASRDYEPPAGEVEQPLARIWQELLHIERVGRNDHFFRLGGNSMTSLRLIVKVAEAFGAYLAATAVFKYPTLHEMAQLIEVLASETVHVADNAQPELEEGSL